MTSQNSNQKMDMFKLIKLLESLDAKVSSDAILALRQQISQGEGINALVQHYSNSQSMRALELLCQIREPHDKALGGFDPPCDNLMLKALLDRLQESMQTSQLATIILLGEIVQKEPSWLPKLPTHALFGTVLRHIGSSKNVVVVVAGVLFFTNLLPHCSVMSEQTLHSIFRMLLQVVEAVRVLRSQSVINTVQKDPDHQLHIAHLAFAAQQLFVLLYGTYPCNLLSRAQSFMSPSRKLSHSKPVIRKKSSPGTFHSSIVALKATASGGEAIATPDNLFRSILNSTLSSIAQSDSTILNDEFWSPSIALGLETPPESRDNTPIHPLARRNPVTMNTLLPPETNRRHTSGSDEFRPRRSSLGQRLSQMLRPRNLSGDNSSNRSINRSPGLLPHGHSSNKSMELDTTKEEEENEIEIQMALAVDERRMSQNSSEEEAQEASESPNESELTSEPLGGFLMRALAPPPSIDDPAADAEVARLTDRSVHFKPEPILFRKDSNGNGRTSSTAAFNTPNMTVSGEQRSGTTGSSSQHSSETATPAPGCLNESSRSDRFSVTSFFSSFNRQRFHSECPPPEEADNDHPDLAMTGIQTDNKERMFRKRSLSCPGNMRAGSQHQLVTLSNQVVNSDLVKKPSKVENTVPGTIDSGYTSAISLLQRFPYLMLVQGQLELEEDKSDAVAEEEREARRSAYMKASCDHHSCLAELGLADRSPGKIYDDMAHILNGLPLEKQKEVLSTRLALVNQHLLYERCRRMMHAQRNRRLFGRLKQQGTVEAELLNLKQRCHTFEKEREQFVASMSEQRRQMIEQKKQAAENDLQNKNQLHKTNQDRIRMQHEMDQLKNRLAATQAENTRLVAEQDTIKRKAEDALAKCSFAERRLEEIEPLRGQLDAAQNSNLRLKDRLAQMDANIRALQDTDALRMAAESERDQLQIYIQKEMTELRMQVKRDWNRAEAAQQNAIAIDLQSREHRNRALELEQLVQRAGLVHQQQLEAAEHKYLSLLSITQKQDAHILDLYRTIEDLQYAIGSRQDATAISLIIPKSSVPAEIVSYDNSQCGSGSSAVFPPEFFGGSESGFLERARSNAMDQETASSFRSKTATL